MNPKIQKLLSSKVKTDRILGKTLLLKENPGLIEKMYKFDDNLNILPAIHIEELGYTYEYYSIGFLKVSYPQLWNQKQNLEKK